MIGLGHYLLVGIALFSLGTFSVLARRNAIGVLLGIELILGAANINFAAFHYFGAGGPAGPAFIVLVILVALGQAVIGLAIVRSMHRSFGTVALSATETLRG